MRLPFLFAAGWIALVGTSVLAAEDPALRIHAFEEPIDALSIGVEEDTIDLAVSGLTDGGWTAWEPLVIELEFDPLLRESAMVMFPRPVSQIRLRGTTSTYALHPIRLSREPVAYAVAGRNTAAPRILSRRQWGADESFAFAGIAATRPGEPDSVVRAAVNGEAPERVQECDTAQRKYPEEFRTVRTVSKEPGGKEYRWARRYSPEIRQLVVHHTAQKLAGDGRSPLERMRALYAYHANGRGWGDIGYHYVIDENGQIYEGRAGGDYVVGGHVYCGNVGTIGVALMGNFEVEKPTYAQTASLQWLLGELGGTYDLDLNRSSVFHGKRMPVVVGHGDLISTECPGYYVRETMGNIRKNVIAGDYDAGVPYPGRGERRGTEGTGIAMEELRPAGDTELTGRPGGLLYVSLLYTPKNGMQRRGRIAEVLRSHSTIGIWQETGEDDLRVRREIVAQKNIPSGETAVLRLRMQLPQQAGIYSVDIGPVTITLKAEGRRTRSPVASPVRQSFISEDTPNRQTPGYRRLAARTSGIAKSKNELPRATSERSNPSASLRTGSIRIRLSYDAENATIDGPDGRRILRKQGGMCALFDDEHLTDLGVVRLDAGDGVLTIASWRRTANRFRGVLECRVLDDVLTLINELPLEDYMAGLAEEPDSEPYEKQKAFAIAARSYAAHYREEANRKFPGMPYDGSDTGASFQEYGGLVFERRNPQWVRAVRETEGLVLQRGNQIIKAAYFSSDDGRTRSPEENGWRDFPFADVFAGKPDPWCRGMPLRGHGVGMSGCGAGGQAREGKSAEEILEYYYPGTEIGNRDG